MNINHHKEKISKNIILTYARAIRTINTEQIDPYMELIEKELLTLFPFLKDCDDNALNWATDIINASSNEEVIETLERIKKIQSSSQQKPWHCRFCGKDTFNVDIEYLSGYDHIQCVLEEAIGCKKNNSSVEKENKLKEIEEKLTKYENELNSLHSELTRLRSDYHHEPTN
jgi:predicted Zn-ribbon and HTH transcriptional regulator